METGCLSEGRIQYLGERRKSATNFTNYHENNNKLVQFVAKKKN